MPLIQKGTLLFAGTNHVCGPGHLLFALSIKSCDRSDRYISKWEKLPETKINPLSSVLCFKEQIFFTSFYESGKKPNPQTPSVGYA